MTCRDGSVLAGAWVSDAFESELDSELTSQAVEAAMGEADKAKSTANAARQVRAACSNSVSHGGKQDSILVRGWDCAAAFPAARRGSIRPADR